MIFISTLIVSNLVFIIYNLLKVAENNRSCYRRLRRELEDLTEKGVCMLGKFQEEGANVMQKLAVQMLCYQLDNTWQYFTRTFKMQVQLVIIVNHSIISNIVGRITSMFSMWNSTFFKMNSAIFPINSMKMRKLSKNWK